MKLKRLKVLIKPFHIRNHMKLTEDTAANCSVTGNKGTHFGGSAWTLSLRGSWIPEICVHRPPVDRFVSKRDTVRALTCNLS